MAHNGELNKRGDRRGKRGKDKGGKREIYKVHYTDESIEYWLDILKTVKKQLMAYLATDKVQQFIERGNRANPPTFTPEELITKGLSYFKFALKHKRNMSIYGLALYLGVDVAIIMRMEQKEYKNDYYKNDIYKPIIKTFKNLVGLFHEEMGADKINPSFHMFVLKALRSGFEETMDLNVNSEPKGLSEEEREKLRGQVKKFTENFSKIPSQNQKLEWRKQ